MPPPVRKTIADLRESDFWKEEDIRLRGSPDIQINGLAYDSRRVQPGDLFMALPGLHVDGHHYVGQAIQRGAVAVVHQTELASYDHRITYLQVPDSRQAMSGIADAFFDHPSRELKVVGVTGTDGKSTTVWLIHQLLEALGQSSGLISTVHLKTGEKLIKNPLRQSTPEAPDTQGLLRRMVSGGKAYAVLEATSHGLSAGTGRLSLVEFTAAVCTNIGHEHLEFHRTFEQYRSDKANLFRALSEKGFGVVNRNDPSHRYLIDQTDAAVYSYGLNSKSADLWARVDKTDLSGSQFSLYYDGEQYQAGLNLPGTYNVENLLAAILTVLHLLPASIQDLLPLLSKLQGVPGRMEAINTGQPFGVIVDYAHTPQSFAKLLPLVRAQTEGRLIVVFGSAGERDLDKRPLQGELAARFSDIIILTDEDPRGEEPVAILEQIGAGCKREKTQQPTELSLIPDRRQAIHRAFALAKMGDTVLLLGKGHEESIIYASGPVPWHEARVARQILTEMGFSP
jgi:UDP-N-acetylmuramoyl-L-alanyl-D-glutamate--2,6-diaminopimelate ligase